MPGLRVRGILASVTGDTKAVHEVLGLLSPSSKYFCRICLVNTEDILKYYESKDLRFRTVEIYERHVKNSTENAKSSSETGVAHQTPLNQLRYFHSAKKSVFDAMHDFLEGVFPFHTSSVTFCDE
jgi:hypothetical protein